MTHSIKFQAFNGEFLPTEAVGMVDGSYHTDKKAIGDFRWKGVANGRYEKKHPIYHKSGELAGYLKNGVRDLGYTFQCVYSDYQSYFLILHQNFNAVMGGGEKVSRLSIVEHTDYFFFGDEKSKFEKTQSFNLPYNWVDGKGLFKLVSYKECLLTLTGAGFKLFDIRRRKIITDVDFDINTKWREPSIALSPKVNIFAIMISHECDVDALTGEPHYMNRIQLYDFKKGVLMGEHTLADTNHHHWKINFSDCGKKLSVKSEKANYQFELKTS